jgi:adenylate cyclase
MEVAAQNGVRLALSDTLRTEAERSGARLKVGSLAGPVETRIRGRLSSLVVWLWRNDQAAELGSQPDAAGSPPYFNSGGGERSNTSPVDRSITSSA